MTDQCEISGLGVLPNGDLGLGRITGGPSGASGNWLHFSTTSGLVLARPDWVLCRINGIVLGDFAGPASLNGVSGYTYRVGIQDWGTPGERTIVEGVPTVETVSATRHYRPRGFTDGSITIADRARVTIPSELPVISGAPGRGRAEVLFTRADTLDPVHCEYRGNGRGRRGGAIPGDRYVLHRCHSLPGLPQVGAGDAIDVTAARVRVRRGARRAGDTTVTVNFDVTPLTVIEPDRDRYLIVIFDAAGDFVLRSEGRLAHGDFVLEMLP